jgi:hypothetical protein
MTESVWWLLVRGDEVIHATKDRAESDRMRITFQDVEQFKHVLPATGDDATEEDGDE